MKVWIRSATVVVVIGAILFYGNYLTQAQEIRMETFQAGEITNVIVFPSNLESQIIPIQEGVQDTLTKYTELWTANRVVDFQTMVILRDEVGVDGVQAEAAIRSSAEALTAGGIRYTFSTPQVCVVWVYMRTAVSAPLFPFLMAHEIAHCFQQFYITHPSSADQDNEWWEQGTAEWLAALVFPQLANAAMRHNATLGEFHSLSQQNHNMTDSVSRREIYEGYGSAYFWMFLASSTYEGVTGIGSPVALLNMLRRVPLNAVGTEDYDQYLEETLANDTNTMIQFGIAVAEGRMHALSDLEALLGPELRLPLPDEVEFNPDHFTLTFRRYRIEADEEVKAVEITAHGVTDESAARFAIRTSSQYRILADGDSFRICLDHGAVNIPMVLSRGNGSAFITASLSFAAVTEEDTTCDPPEPDIADMMTLPGWEVTNVGNSSSPNNTVLFLPVNEGKTLIEIWDGQDIVYERVSDTLYVAEQTIGPRSYQIQAELKFIDENTRSSISTVTSGPTVTANNEFRYRRTNDLWRVMTEVNRNLLNYSMLGSCLGLRDVTPGIIWTTGDSFVPVRTFNNSSTLAIGARLFSGGPRLFTLNQTTPFGQGVRRTTIELTLTSPRSGWIFYHDIVDKRRDCQLIYESELYPLGKDHLTSLLSSAH